MKKLIILVAIFILLFPFITIAADYPCADKYCNPNVQSLLNFLKYIADNELGVLPFQWVHNIDSGAWDDETQDNNFDLRVRYVFEQTGKWPPGLGGNLYGATHYDDQGPTIEAYSDLGGAGVIHGAWCPTDVFDDDCTDPFTVKPNDNCTASNSATGVCPDDFNSNVGLDNLVTDDGESPYDRWQTYKEDIADAYEDAESRGYVAFARPFREMNARWFWFSEDQCPGTQMDANDFQDLYKDFFHYITGEVSDCDAAGDPYSCCTGSGIGTCRGIHNVIWVFGPTHYWGPVNGGDDSPPPFDRGSWHHWMPTNCGPDADRYCFDILGPTLYKGQMYGGPSGAPTGSQDDDWVYVDDHGAEASWADAGSGRYSAISGKVGSFATNSGSTDWGDPVNTSNTDCMSSGDPYACCTGRGTGTCSADTCPDDVDASQEWCWLWDITYGGKIYTYGDQTSNSPRVKYMRYPATMQTEMRAIGRIMALGEASADDLVSDWLTAWAANFADYVYALFWGTGLRGATGELYSFMNHVLVISRDELIDTWQPINSYPSGGATEIDATSLLTLKTNGEDILYRPWDASKHEVAITDQGEVDWGTTVYDSGWTTTSGDPDSCGGGTDKKKHCSDVPADTLSEAVTYYWHACFWVDIDGDGVKDTSPDEITCSDATSFTTSGGPAGGEGALYILQDTGTGEVELGPSGTGKVYTD